MALKVVQWATGGVGIAAINGVLEHPDLELAGCWVHSPDKAGKDVGEIIGTEPLGVTATNSVDDILALDADAVIYSPLLPNPDEVAALLRSGKNVVTPVGWFYPSEKQAAPLRAAALEGNATLHGTGIAPGGISEKFPLLLSAMATGVTFVRAEEFSDLRTYEAPDVVRHVMGFGDTPDKALSGPMQKMLDGGFIQAVRMIVAKIGFNADPRIRASQEVAVATATDRLADRGDRARAGRRSALPLGGPSRRRGRGPRDGQLAHGRGKPQARMDIRPSRATLRDGGPRQPGLHRHDQGLPVREPRRRLEDRQRCRRHRRALRELRPAVCAAEPGIATYLDLPLISGKAAPRLS